MLKTCKIEDNEQSESRNLRNEQLKGWVTRPVETIKETSKAKGKTGKLTAKKENHGIRCVNWMPFNTYCILQARRISAKFLLQKPSLRRIATIKCEKSQLAKCSCNPTQVGVVNLRRIGLRPA